MKNDLGTQSQILLDISKPRRRTFVSQLQVHTIPMLMLLPFMLLFLVFLVYPVLKSLFLSFTDYNAVREPSFVGLQNYSEILHDPRFYKALQNTSIYTFSSVILTNIIGLGLAMAFGSQRVLDQILRGIFFLPAVAGGIAIATVWKWILSSEDYGLLNTIIGWFGFESVSWLGMPKYAVPVLIMYTVWNGLGYSMILFVSNLRSIPNELYEAAAIDGASPWDRFVKITVPLLRPTFIYTTVTGIIGAFQVFSEPYIFFADVHNVGGILDSGLTVVTYLFEKGFYRFQMGEASAVAWILFAICFVLTLINLRVQRANESVQ
ncbi:carbohydrate ABC transporter permease [Deinococcus roseus]|uniref:Sugar ABC transporter permease n=1 Tax=Deinococcus roseus TaxID=392414 RepID=A0ABQ2DJ86_9DEIO|nr:sugar ABC transporter permease [Deinococcus roseus]GGJ59107.1 sugar ABC transporter permease [Deinococcus roseus]